MDHPKSIVYSSFKKHKIFSDISEEFVNIRNNNLLDFENIQYFGLFVGELFVIQKPCLLKPLCIVLLFNIEF